ncbi:MAG TPA: hypothetical protein VKB77_06755 [Terriglobales bacterium]|nr:hypothetical protein [Terriglobales bacterium]
MNCIKHQGIRTVLVLAASLIAASAASAQSAGPKPQVPGNPTSNVNVVNTKSSPANALDVERAARIPYESTQQSIGYPQETTTFPAAPSGFRLVIQHISCTFLMNPGSTQLPSITLFTNDGTYTGRASFIGQVGGIGSQTFGALNADLLSYWDSSNGQPLVVANGDFYPSVINWMTLSGYLENCSLTGCPAVQR